jgi:hypothetical protein
MAEIHIGVRVSFRGRALRVIGFTPSGVEPRRIFVEDEDSGERFVITTRVLGVDAAEPPCVRSLTVAES